MSQFESETMDLDDDDEEDFLFKAHPKGINVDDDDEMMDFIASLLNEEEQQPFGLAPMTTTMDETTTNENPPAEVSLQEDEDLSDSGSTTTTPFQQDAKYCVPLVLASPPQEDTSTIAVDHRSYLSCPGFVKVVEDHTNRKCNKCNTRKRSVPKSPNLLCPNLVNEIQKHIGGCVDCPE